MITKPRLLQGTLWLIVGAGLASTAFGQNRPRILPVPHDPLELATGQTQVAGTPESRAAALQLLTRARQNFALRTAGQAYDLKVSFAVNPLGETNYDGTWE